MKFKVLYRNENGPIDEFSASTLEQYLQQAKELPRLRILSKEEINNRYDKSLSLYDYVLYCEDGYD